MLVRVAIAALLFSTVACGGRPASPTAPAGFDAPTSGPAAVAGATIQGQVQSGTAAMAATTGAAASGLTVTVVGTSISATVSGTGQFTLNGVPAGSSQLNFTGTGVNVSVNISPVQGTETISITVKISGEKAEIESEAHDNHGEAELHGIVSALSGTSATFDFNVGGMKVRGDAQTTFFGDGNKADTFSKLRNGARVEVKGLTQDGFVYAQRIHINGGNSGDDPADHDANDDDDDDPPGDDHGNGQHDDDNQAGEAEASGTISGITTGCPNITFSVGGSSVATSKSTEFKGAACTALKNGDRVKVEGTRQSSGGAILAREVKRQ